SPRPVEFKEWHVPSCDHDDHCVGTDPTLARQSNLVAYAVDGADPSDILSLQCAAECVLTSVFQASREAVYLFIAGVSLDTKVKLERPPLHRFASSHHNRGVVLFDGLSVLCQIWIGK